MMQRSCHHFPKPGCSAHLVSRYLWENEEISDNTSGSVPFRLQSGRQGATSG